MLMCPRWPYAYRHEQFSICPFLLHVCMFKGCPSIHLYHMYIHIDNVTTSSKPIGWLRLVGSSKIYFVFAEYSLFYRALLQKSPTILRSLLIVATPYYSWYYGYSVSYMHICMYVYIFVYIQLLDTGTKARSRLENLCAWHCMYIWGLGFRLGFDCCGRGCILNVQIHIHTHTRTHTFIRLQISPLCALHWRVDVDVCGCECAGVWVWVCSCVGGSVRVCECECVGVW